MSPVAPIGAVVIRKVTEAVALRGGFAALILAELAKGKAKEKRKGTETRIRRKESPR